MFCSECGTENRNDRKFCTNCGAALIDYTKPRENLVMPEDIEKKQEIVTKRKALNKRFNIALALIMLIAIALTVLAFYYKANLRIIFGGCALVACLTFLLVWIIKVVKIKKLSK